MPGAGPRNPPWESLHVARIALAPVYCPLSGYSGACQQITVEIWHLV